MLDETTNAIGSPSGGARSPRAWLAVTLAALVALALITWLGLDRTSWGDWAGEARPSVDALLAGRFAGFLRSAPAYGGSLLLRAPFMLLTRVWHGGGLAVYRAGAAPCLAASAALALWLSSRMARRGCGLLAQATTVALCIASPVAIPALVLGHPEDILGAALCVAAVACAQRDHAVCSGLLVGLAVANKSWGVLAIGPVLATLPRDRGRALAATVVTAGAIVAPFMLVRSGGLAGQAAGAGAVSGGLFSPWQLWWVFGSHMPGVAGSFRVGPGWLNGLGHTLPIAIMPPLTLAYMARHPPDRRGPDALLLLALLLLLRCALDPWDTAYYAVPFLTALLAWEASVHDRPPVIALIASLAAWFVLQGTTIMFGDARNVLALVYALAVLPAIIAMGWRLFAAPRRATACVADLHAAAI